MSDVTLRTLADRIEIAELLARYADMVDRRDWPRMNRIFALEATIDFRPSGGPNGPFREMLAWLDRALDSWPKNLHLITNVIVDLDGDRASSRCYFHVSIARETHDGNQYTVTDSGRFIDQLIRSANGWRIVSRVCEQIVREGQLPKGYTIPR
jgi:3-phenylpropionate/cinnamic acid dioxygenase small subunit